MTTSAAAECAFLYYPVFFFFIVLFSFFSCVFSFFRSSLILYIYNHSLVWLGWPGPVAVEAAACRHVCNEYYANICTLYTVHNTCFRDFTPHPNSVLLLLLLMLSLCLFTGSMTSMIPNRVSCNRVVYSKHVLKHVLCESAVRVDIHAHVASFFKVMCATFAYCHKCFSCVYSLNTSARFVFFGKLWFKGRFLCIGSFIDGVFGHFRRSFRVQNLIYNNFIFRCSRAFVIYVQILIKNKYTYCVKSWPNIFQSFP